MAHPNGRFGGPGGGMPREVVREIRDLLVAGATWEQTAAAVGVSKRTIARTLNEAGGMPPRWTNRPSSQLSLADREELMLGLQAGHNYATIGRAINRDRSTVKREVDNNGGRDAYRAWRADRRAHTLACRPKVSKLMSNPKLRAQVEAWLLKRWSPEQIEARLQVDFPDDPEMRVSHETIYQSLYVQAKGGFRKELAEQLRSGRTRRKPRSKLTSGTNRPGRIAGMINIADRPADIEDRAVPGHWEGDLIIGVNGQSAIITLVERATRFLMMVALDGNHKADTVAAAMAAHIQQLPVQLRRSITWDQGKEMAGHAAFTIATDIDVYFCDPHSPWQRGTNENTNGLIRQYLPKGIDLYLHNQADLDAITDELNGRPRQTLHWMTPSEQFTKLVAATP